MTKSYSIVFSACILLCLSANSFSAEVTDELKVRRSSHPAFLPVMGATFGWMAYELGRNPEHAQNYYSLFVIGSLGDLQTRTGKLAFAFGSAMTLANYHFDRSDTVDSLESRQGNLAVFGLSALTLLGINAYFHKQKSEALQFRSGLVNDSIVIGFNYEF